MKQILLIFLLLVFTFIFSSSLLASGFQLKTVGGMNVEGVTYDQLWYTNSNVTFTGIALQNAQVTATINGTSNTITADASGNWSYTATLIQGDNNVSFSSDGSTISFVLTVGTVPDGVGSLPAAQTPTVGVATPTIILSTLGIFSVLAAIFLFRRNYLRA